MSNLTTKRLVSSILTITMTFFVLALPKPARAEKVYNISFPVYFTDFNSCANNGAGEEINFSGDLHVRWSITLDGNGGFHGSSLEQYQGVGGVGLTTGTKYRCNAAVPEIFNGKVGENYSLVIGIRYVGQGPENNFMVMIRKHYTVDANGDLTSFIDESRIECK